LENKLEKKLDKKLGKELITTMLKIRYFEQAAKALYKEGQIPGSIHLYIGEEAIAAGACANLEESDYISSTHRGHGHIIARGGNLNRIMAELFGKADGYNGGRGGSMHIAAMELGMLGANGIVGAGIPLATGAAFSSFVRKSGQVTICFFGDGATNQGTFHESLNIASVFTLPVVYVCENNLYGVGTCIKNTTKCQQLSIRSFSYGIEGITIDGNDVMAVYETVGRAVTKARSGKGPTFIEAETYRWGSHFEGEPDTYRSPEEVKKWKEMDPIIRFERELTANNIMSAREIKLLHKDIKNQVDEAVDFAKASRQPDTDDVLKYVLN